MTSPRVELHYSTEHIFSDDDDARKAGWATVVRPLVDVTLGGVLAMAGGVVGAKLDRDSAADARREDRVVEAYSTFLSDLTDAAIALGHWHGAVGRGDDVEIEFVHQQLRDDAAALIDSAGMVAVVGSERAVDLALTSPTIVQDGLDATTPEEVDVQVTAIAELIVRFRTQTRFELGK